MGLFLSFLFFIFLANNLISILKQRKSHITLLIFISNIKKKHFFRIFFLTKIKVFKNIKKKTQKIKKRKRNEIIIYKFINLIHLNSLLFCYYLRILAK